MDATGAAQHPYREPQGRLRYGGAWRRYRAHRVAFWLARVLPMVGCVLLPVSPAACASLIGVSVAFLALGPRSFRCPRCEMEFARMSLLWGVQRPKECWNCGLHVGDEPRPADKVGDGAPPSWIATQRAAYRSFVWLGVSTTLVPVAVWIAVAILYPPPEPWRYMVTGSPYSSVPEQVLRFVTGEPGATQDVNDAANDLERDGLYRELEAVSYEIMREYETSAATLPNAEFDVGREVPVERLPARFHKLGGSWRHSLQVILRVDAASKPTQVRLHWGHGRHAVIVYAKPPAHPPSGFHVRRVSPRTYVVANES